MNRAVLWLLLGVVAFVVGVVAIAPELLADLGTAGGAVGVALAAIVPATVLAAVFVSSRRRRDRARSRDLVAADRDAAARDTTSDRGA
jgi:uncharacterized membrane protein